MQLWQDIALKQLIHTIVTYLLSSNQPYYEEIVAIDGPVAQINYYKSQTQSLHEDEDPSLPRSCQLTADTDSHELNRASFNWRQLLRNIFKLQTLRF